MNQKIDKIIFLDIDGVFNSVKWFESKDYGIAKKELPYPLWSLDPEPIELFVKLLKEIKAKIVVSSVWRATRNMKYFRDLFKQRGFPFPRGTFIGKTPNLMNDIRGKEIEKWINENHFNGNYVIIDDDDDMLPGQKLVQIDEQVGFSERNYQKVVEYLNFG